MGVWNQRNVKALQLYLTNISLYKVIYLSMNKIQLFHFNFQRIFFP